MAIEISEEKAGAVRILALGGRLDTETAPDFELKAHDLYTEGDRHFVVDLSGIDYVSSAGLRVLLSLAKQVDGGKGSLQLCGLPPHVKQVFDLAGFSKLLNLQPTLKGVLSSHPEAQGIDAGKVGELARQLLGERADAVPAASSSAAPASPQLQNSAASLLGAKAPPRSRQKQGLWARFMGWLRGE
jgi:anti-anti-sigma factor